MAISLFLSASGCSDSAAGSHQLHSRFFSAVQVIGSRGTGAGQFNKPRSVAVDRNDNLYVVDLTGRVQKFSPDGQYLLAWQMPETDKGKPKGMIKDADGNVVVIEPHYSRVNHFDPMGKLLVQWGVNGTNEGRLQFPRSVAVNSKGDLFVSEYGLVERIQHFTHRGREFVQAFGSPGVEKGQLNRAEGLGIAPDDTLIVADSCNHRIQVFSAGGKFLRSFGHAGSAIGELSYPYDVRVDRTGVRFVCEFGNSRVQIFDINDQPIETIGGAGIDPGQMNNPWAIALDSKGNLYVADSANHRVQKFIRRNPFAPGLAAASGHEREQRLVANR
jgi:DNA-binding beta-propeller fold protein YncE